MGRLLLKRAYEGPSSSDGLRILVDRLWPRGLRKEAARLDAWLKDAAPSPGLRTWYGHDPERWEEFRSLYLEELRAKPEALKPIREALESSDVTLVYAAKEPSLSHALVLKEFLEIPASTPPRRSP